MDTTSNVISLCGIILFMCLGIAVSFQLNSNVLNTDTFEDNDARTRHKRNASDITEDNNNKTIIVSANTSPKPIPQWKIDLQNNKWYGSEDYMQRKLYKDHPDKKPTVCYNNVTQGGNVTVLRHFLCPMKNQSDAFIFCCGIAGEQHCCDKVAHEGEENIIQDIDLATGLGIAASFIGAVSFCMFLYCCCCQRRPEIHDGIKLIWVRRSFGKEMNRLEQQNAHAQQRLALGTSRTGSRLGSRVGSRQGSRQGSRNTSVGPSPSVSRRASMEPNLHPSSHLSKGTGRTPSGKRKAALELPSSSVTITVTTPSDDHGPTEPLLKTSEQKGNQDNEQNEAL